VSSRSFPITFIFIMQLPPTPVTTILACVISVVDDVLPWGWSLEGPPATTTCNPWNQHHQP